MAKDRVDCRVPGIFKIVFCIWCCFICIDNIMFAYGLSSYANVSRSWKNNWLIDGGIHIFGDTCTAFTALYSRESDGYPPYGFGFFTNQTSNSFILAIYMGSLDDEDSSPVVVWCANRDHPVHDDATLSLTSEGDLVLRDADGSFVWSTNTSGHSVKSIELQENGNLVLLNGKGEAIWDSFEFPTDTLLYDQALPVGRRLTSSTSTSNFSTGIFYVIPGSDGYIHAFVDLDPPQEYGDFLGIWRPEFPYSFNTSFLPYSPYAYVHLDQNGHLNLFEWN
ncbi:hypothetical protein BVRB_4g074290 [Beta vulgaris subsp. vulgaris]|nr:hypothetical protein BVRB_4g074290 [Beta vulgaris subsp. vulgaris]